MMTAIRTDDLLDLVIVQVLAHDPANRPIQRETNVAPKARPVGGKTTLGERRAHRSGDATF